MPDRESLLAAVYERREDDAPRLVYADWLTDHGDPRGEFVQIQCRLARMSDDDPTRPALQHREQELLTRHEQAWRAELPAMPGFVWGPFRRGFVESASVPDPSPQVLRLDLDDHFLGVCRKQPWHLRPLLAALTDARVDASHWHEAALAFLPTSDWPALAEQALAALEKDQKNKAAQEVFEAAYEQCPASLHPHLDRVFRLEAYARRTAPWRGSGVRHAEFLTRLVREGEAEQARRAWWLMLATRDETVIRLALKHAVELHRRQGGQASDYERWLKANLEEEGLAREQGQIRRLHGDRPWHLRFPDGYLDEEDGIHRQRFHPTWGDLSDLSAPMRFGGEGAGKCGSCRGKLHHLITLAPVPADLGVSLPRLTLAVCLSCLGWEQHSLFYDHGAKGLPRCRRKAARVTPQFPAGPLQEVEVRLGRAHPRWAWGRWGSGVQRNLHRVGGPPWWVQSADYPDCPACGRAMAFLMQMDSHFPTADGQHDWLWGSGGVAYCHWCDRCRVSGWFWQCT